MSARGPDAGSDVGSPDPSSSDGEHPDGDVIPLMTPLADIRRIFRTHDVVIVRDETVNKFLRVDDGSEVLMEEQVLEFSGAVPEVAYSVTPIDDREALDWEPDENRVRYVSVVAQSPWTIAARELGRAKIAVIIGIVLLVLLAGVAVGATLF